MSAGPSHLSVAADDAADLRRAHAELDAEQRHLDRSFARLEALKELMAAALGEARAAERGGALFQRTDRDVAEATAAARLGDLRLGDLALFFGRIDRDLPDDDPDRALHIGRVGLLDPDGTALVVDWRAPVSSAFYRATVGEPLGVVRRRQITVRGPRVIAIDDELLDRKALDSAGRDLTLVGEAALLAALDRARTGHMADIVATIQAEQDAIVRAPLSQCTVVQGGPGTGKTAVGLHRVAYLLYRHRAVLERQGVLLVGPNPTFLRYVEHVVPSLGETSLRLATCGQLRDEPVTAVDPPAVAAVKADPRMVDVLAAGVRLRERPLPGALVIPHGRHLLHLGRDDQRRMLARARRIAEARGLRHNPARPLVERLLVAELWRLHVDAERREIVAGVRSAEVELDDLTADELDDLLGAEGPDAAARRLEAVEPQADPTDAASFGPPPPVPSDFRVDMLASVPVREALERIWPVLSPARFLLDLFGSPAILRAAAREQLAETELSALGRRRLADPAAASWSEHDIALLDEAAALFGPPPARRLGRASRRSDGDELLIDTVLSTGAMATVGLDEVMEADLRARLREQAALDRGAPPAPEPEPDGPAVAGHVVVDEAQDLSAMQWRMVARRLSGSSVTILGDLAQGSRSWSPRSWAEVREWIGGAGRDARTIELEVGYRAPLEVMALAAPVLAAIDPALVAPRSVRASGSPSRVVAAAPGGLASVVVAEVAAAREAVGRGTVGVLCADRMVEQVAAALGTTAAEGPDALRRDLVVVGVEQAKGLEFDGVVVVEPSAFGAGRSGLSLLYVALTRATRRLAVVHETPLPAAVAGSAGWS